MERKPHIRWMIKRDMAEVVEIERLSFEYPWSEDDFKRYLQGRKVIGMVAEEGDRVVAYMIYELDRKRVQLANIAVHPDFRGMGVGTALIASLQGKLSEGRRVRICTEVRERNLDAQLFFKQFGFEAINVLRDFYVDTDEDCYVFVFRHSSLMEVPA